jgi:hypothetical protein
MNLAEQSSFVQSLVDQPYDQDALFVVHEAMAQDPGAYAALLVEAATLTREHVAASRWLTEAARVRLQTLGDQRGGVRLLEAALERDPVNLRAAEHLVELYRAHQEDEELATVLRARAAALHARYVREPVELPRAALAFEKLSGVFEAIGDTAEAIAALRTALELERVRSRNTTPSPPPDGPPDGPPESAFRSLAPRSSPGAAPRPESPWSAHPVRDPRDTMPSPLPPAPSSGPRPTSATELRETISPESAAPPQPERGNPLLAVIEALHALRRSDDVVDGAALVLRTALAAIPSLAAFVHVVDVGTRDFVVVAAAGEQSSEVIGTRTAEGDPVMGRALTDMQAITLDAGLHGWFVASRWQAVRPERTVLCAPVQYDGAHLGAIELVDPTDRGTFTDADRHAMTYMGERFAEFLADRSLTF